MNGTEKVLLTKSKETQATYGESINGYEAELFKRLKLLRKEIADDENVPAYVVLSDASLREIATYLPTSKESFRKINGFGEVKIEKYGKQFWNVVADFCTEQGLKTKMHLKASKPARHERPERDSDTKKETLRLYEAGHSIDDIAQLRELTHGTIEGHIAYYIQQKRFSVFEFLNEDRVEKIEAAIKRYPSKSANGIKYDLGDEYGFGEVRMVMAHQGNLVREPSY